MSQGPFFGNWMVAVAEAAEVAGSSDLDRASASELTKAWDLVMMAADLNRRQLAEQIADEVHLPVADFSAREPYAAKLVPAPLARRRHVMPLRCNNRDLVIATANPLSHKARHEIEGVAGRDVHFEVAAPVDIGLAMVKTYGKTVASDTRPADPPDQVRPEGPHVLVVDDDAGARILLRSTLEAAGFSVMVAADGPEALDILQSPERFDLITLDYWMDKMNGLRVLQQVRSNPDVGAIPVIMVTGADDRGIAMSLFEAGADDFIVKPIDAPLFILRIQAVLRRRRVS